MMSPPSREDCRCFCKAGCGTKGLGPPKGRAFGGLGFVSARLPLFLIALSPGCDRRSGIPPEVPGVLRGPSDCMGPGFLLLKSPILETPKSQLSPESPAQPPGPLGPAVLMAPRPSAQGQASDSRVPASSRSVLFL